MPAARTPTSPPFDVVIVVSAPIAHETFSGRTLVDRHVEMLKRLGATAPRIVAADEWRADENAGPQLLITAERVFDPRLYAALLDSDTPTILTDDGIAIGLETRHPARAQVAREIGTMPAYSRELRRSIRPYWREVRTLGDRPAVARLLVEASGKGHQDLPAAVINAPIEKAIARVLADTSITPNQLTLACNAVAYLVALLLARGDVLAGAVGAMVVGVLDGLDGRQARVQIRTSELGRVEHLLDKLYEILWMVALAYGLSSGFTSPGFARELVWWIAAYAVDTACYDLTKQRFGVQLDEISPLDRAIRLFAGRRNVYSCILLAGALAGHAVAAWHAIVIWAVVTAVVHGLRVASLLLFRRRTSAR